MRLARVLTLVVTCATALLLAGCFSTKQAVLEPTDGDALPGGPGVYKMLDEDGKPAAELQLSILRSTAPGQRYRARSTTISDGKTKVDEGELIIKYVGGDTYLTEFKGGPNQYFLAAAIITPTKFTVMAVDAEMLATMAENHKIRVVQEPITGDNGDIKRAVDAGESLLVKTMEGPVLHAPKETALAIALEMAESSSLVPLEDMDYSRPEK